MIFLYAHVIVCVVGVTMSHQPAFQRLLVLTGKVELFFTNVYHLPGVFLIAQK